MGKIWGWGWTLSTRQTASLSMPSAVLRPGSLLWPPGAVMVSLYSQWRFSPMPM